jgi:transposase
MAQYRQHREPCTPACRWWKRGAQENAIGRSKGGLTTKVHLVVDALGLPTTFEITEGNRHDSQPAPKLIEKTQPKMMLGDKAYDSDQIRAKIAETGTAVIPPKANRLNPPDCDYETYKARSEIECTFNLLKQARRFATRYEKTLRNYSAVVTIGCMMLWLRI